MVVNQQFTRTGATLSGRRASSGVQTFTVLQCLAWGNQKQLTSKTCRVHDMCKVSENSERLLKLEAIMVTMMNYEASCGC